MSHTRRQYSIGFMGFSQTGKTTLFSSLREKFGLPKQVGEVIDESIDSFCIKREDDIKLSVWDAKFDLNYSHRSIPAIISQTVLIFIVYDISSLFSMDIGYYYKIAMMLADLNCKLVLVGNKSDLNGEQYVTVPYINQIKNDYKIDDQIDVTAKEPESMVNFFSFFEKLLEKAIPLPEILISPSEEIGHREKLSSL